MPSSLCRQICLATRPPSPPSSPPSPPSSPSPPLLPGGYFITGPCSLTDGGSCAASPNYPNSYGYNEECTISGVPPVELETVAFEVEAFGCSYDYHNQRHEVLRHLGAEWRGGGGRRYRVAIG